VDRDSSDRLWITVEVRHITVACHWRDGFLGTDCTALIQSSMVIALLREDATGRAAQIVARVV
jgi:hypothetical protein